MAGVASRSLLYHQVLILVLCHLGCLGLRLSYNIVDRKRGLPHFFRWVWDDGVHSILSLLALYIQWLQAPDYGVLDFCDVLAFEDDALALAKGFDHQGLQPDALVYGFLWIVNGTGIEFRKPEVTIVHGVFRVELRGSQYFHHLSLDVLASNLAHQGVV